MLNLCANAALRCEQRCHKAKPLHHKHKTQREAENAKRWESLLNALLCNYYGFAFALAPLTDMKRVLAALTRAGFAARCRPGIV